MNLAEDLLQHAQDLLNPEHFVNLGQLESPTRYRRAVSACYYALFYTLTGDATAIMAPNVSEAVNHRIRRWFDHAEMQRVCGRFTKTVHDQPLLGLVGSASPPDLQQVAASFLLLQEERHKADYDLGYFLTTLECRLLVQAALESTETWANIRSSAEVNIFILSLLLWKNFERDRP